jgi:hypothetical protein
MKLYSPRHLDKKKRKTKKNSQDPTTPPPPTSNRGFCQFAISISISIPPQQPSFYTTQTNFLTNSRTMHNSIKRIAIFVIPSHPPGERLPKKKKFPQLYLLTNPARTRLGADGGGYLKLPTLVSPSSAQLSSAQLKHVQYIPLLRYPSP